MGFVGGHSYVGVVGLVLLRLHRVGYVRLVPLHTGPGGVQIDFEALVCLSGRLRQRVCCGQVPQYI